MLDNDYISKLKNDFKSALSNVYCGIEYPVAWDEHVRKAVAVIQEAGIQVAQIKVKWGRLVIYIYFPENWRAENFWKWVACEMAIGQAVEACGVFKKERL